MHLRAVRLEEGVNKGISIMLIFGNVVSKVHENGLVEFLGLDIRLGMIRCCCQLFNTKESPHRDKAFADELNTVVSKVFR